MRTKQRYRVCLGAVTAIALMAGLAGVSAPAVAQTGPTAEEIVRRLDANEVQGTSHATATMTIRDRFGERTSTMETWGKGRDLALIEFTSPAERGQKVLRTEDEIYLYYPDAAELVRLQGAALRESMLGSDISYEDMTGGKTLLETYEAELLGEETVEGHRCYQVEFVARRRNVAYPKQIMWIDAELFVARRSEQYALSGRLLKSGSLHDIQEIDGYYVATRIVISDALKRNSSTELVLEDIEFDIRLRDDLFSLEELSW